MSIARAGETVRLSGHCGAEEGEALLAALSDGATRIDLTDCEHLHAALLQLLMAFDVEVTGPPPGFLGRWVHPAIIAQGEPSSAQAEE